MPQVHDTQALLNRLVRLLEDILAAQPEGITEHLLFMRLAERGENAFGEQAFSGDLALFQSHFMLFHSLYQLRAELRKRGHGDLEIHCLNIQWHPRAEFTEEALALLDPLQTYYEDINNLTSTGEEDVSTMLLDFWSLLDLDGERADALNILGLQDPVEVEQIKARYRQLALNMHPDRGGDEQDIRQLNTAMDSLMRRARTPNL